MAEEMNTEVEIARVVEKDLPQRASVGILGFLLVSLSGYCLLKYAVARTSDEQLVALLLWIGNILFWGVFLIGRLISLGRNSVINRDTTPADYRRG